MTPLTADSFFEFVQAHRFALVHFWASWNGHDVQMKAFLDMEIPAELRELVAIGSMEVDPPEHHDICRRLKIVNIPFLAFYRGGSLIGTVTGLGKREILERLDQLVAVS